MTLAAFLEKILIEGLLWPEGDHEGETLAFAYLSGTNTGPCNHNIRTRRLQVHYHFDHARDIRSSLTNDIMASSTATEMHQTNSGTS